MVTGSLENDPEEVQKLEKFMVTGSLENNPDEVQKLEKFMVTGSLAKKAPALTLRRAHRR
jgi:hypothetical protein